SGPCGWSAIRTGLAVRLAASSGSAGPIFLRFGWGRRPHPSTDFFEKIELALDKRAKAWVISPVALVFSSREADPAREGPAPRNPGGGFFRPRPSGPNTATEG